MGRLKTGNEREYKRQLKKNEMKIRRRNPYVSTEINPIDTSILTQKSRDIVRNNMKRDWITRNSRCPCNSGLRFKKCCMEVENA